MEYIVYTDLDGTLIDEGYSLKDSRRVLEQILGKNIPVIFCTSKTRLETLHYQKLAGVKDPFIVENGSAIIIPKDCMLYNEADVEADGGYKVIELVEKGLVRQKVGKIRSDYGLSFTGFHDMTLEELMEDSGLSREEAVMAREREYTVAAKDLDGEDKTILLQNGLKLIQGGRYVGIGLSSKGDAVKKLTEAYRRRHPLAKTIGVGDSPNDYSMLKKCDKGVLVKKPGGGYAKNPPSHIILSEEVGPKGFSLSLKELILD